MIIYFNRNCPLGVINIWKMIIFLCQLFNFFKHLFVIKFLIISALKIQHPTFDLLRMTVLQQQFIQLIQHSKMLCSKSSFNRKYSMTISRYFFIFLMNVLHNGIDNSKWVNLLVDWVDFNKAHTLQ